MRSEFEGEQSKLLSALRDEHREWMDNVQAEYENKVERLNEYVAEVFDGDGEALSYSESLSRFHTEAEAALVSIRETSDSIASARDTVLDEHGLFQTMDEASGEIDTLRRRAEAHVERFSETEKMLYGDGEEQLGLEVAILQAKKQTDDEIKSYRKKINDLLKTIDGALSGATNIELAKVFSDKNKKFRTPKLLWGMLFFLSLMGLVGVTYMTELPFSILPSYKYDTVSESAVSVESTSQVLSRLEGASELYIYLFYFLKRFTILVAIVWMAVFSSRRYSQVLRLEHEYMHKEAVARSYMGHKKQLETLGGEQADQLLVRLAGTMIETISYNPSDTLGDVYHSDQGPIAKKGGLLNGVLNIGKK